MNDPKTTAADARPIRAWLLGGGPTAADLPEVIAGARLDDIDVAVASMSDLLARLRGIFEQEIGRLEAELGGEPIELDD
jgi:hypothetical protein